MNGADWLVIAAAAARVIRAAPDLVDSVKRFVDEISQHEQPPPAVRAIIDEHVTAAENRKPG